MGVHSYLQLSQEPGGNVPPSLFPYGCKTSKFI
jgi:hypothetical protein